MRFVRSIGPVLLLAFLPVCAALAQEGTTASKLIQHRPPQKSFLLYIGSFTATAPNGHPDGGAPSKGIYVARLNTQTGELSAPSLVAEVNNTSFLAVSPDQRFLYAITESNPEAFVSSYAIDSHTGHLRMINRLPSGGAGTVFLSLDKTGKFVLLANYGSGSVTVIQVNPGGSLGKLTSFVQHAAPRVAGAAQTGASVAAHPHETVVSPDNKFVIVPDLGLNKIFIYRFDAVKGVLELPATAVDIPGNEGPRHFVFSPDGRFGYLIAQNTGDVHVFSWDASAGALSPVQTAASFPKGLDAMNISGEIGMTPDGRYLYESNRRSHDSGRELGPDSIVAYGVDHDAGTLTQAQEVDRGESIPRCFSIDPTGRYMAVGAQQLNRVDLYRIDPLEGKLTATGSSIAVHTPACMQFVTVQ